MYTVKASKATDKEKRHAGKVFHEEGYFWFEGRIDDVIKSSGYRIGPFNFAMLHTEILYWKIWISVKSMTAITEHFSM